MLGKGLELITITLLVLRLVDHLEKCSLFPDFQYGFRSSWSTADLLTVVSDRIAKVFNMSGTTWAVALDIFEAFNRALHAGLLQKCKSYGISSRIFGLILSYLSNRQLWVVLDGKSAFKLLFETHFAINTPSSASILACCRWKFHLRFE